MTEKAVAKEINLFFKKGKSGAVLYNSPVWKAINQGLTGTGRKIKFLSRGKNIRDIKRGSFDF